MHTLIIAENSDDVAAMPRITLPKGIDPLRYVLQVWGGGSPNAAMVTGSDGNLGAVALASADRTKRRIFEFAEHCLSTDLLNDEVRIQILFLFHRSHRKNVRALVKAIRMLGADANWRKLPDKHHRALNARRIVLLSCESGIEANPADAVAYPSFMRQFHDLRVASAVAFRLERKPPPSRPPEFWDPFIYTFSTGDFLHGGTMIHPNLVSFIRFSNTAVLGSGDHERVDDGPGAANTTTPAAGKIHKYEGANYVGSIDVPAGTTYDIVSDNF